ncbi:MAG: bifunctional UDP-4-keto-pentose/UDP-xylose synthase, partial [Phycisphaerae bacterium]|nr:bifunctional UDP-4-keto-pentose/UDP-xylose synthase [Phycisphaerae bacterium]
MKILVLGGGGFIGSHMVDRLLADTDHEVVAYDLYDEKLADSAGHPRLTFVEGDIRDDKERLQKMIRECDLVIDLIAHANPALYVSMPLEVFKLNFDENLWIAEKCADLGKRVIQFSTCEVYGKTIVPLAGGKLADPENPEYATFHEDRAQMIMGPVCKQRWIYASAKQLLERILHAYGLEDRLDYTIIRPFNFIGPRIDYLPSEEDGNPRVFSHFVNALKEGGEMPLVDGGHHRRSYTLIDDAVDCILLIIEKADACKHQIFNIGTPGNEVSIRQMAERMIEIFKRKWWDGKSPLPTLKDVPGKDFYGEGYEDCDRRIPDITKARTLLGWEPKFKLDEVLERSMAYW